MLTSYEENPINQSYKIIESPYVPTHKHTLVYRTWKERLFTLPWEPFKKSKVLTELSLQFYISYDTIIIHPSNRDVFNKIISS